MRQRLAWPAALALVAAPLLAALAGTRGPLTITLNLGPGDAPYVEGFAPQYEIDDKVGTHWTTYHAAVSLPLQVSGGPAELSYRFARVFGETAQVEVAFAGRAVDRFSCRGGAVLERTAALGVLPPTPVRVGIESDSHERKDRGLKMDWVRLRLPPGGRVRLTGPAAAMPALTVGLVLVLHLLAGWSPWRAVLFAAPWAAAAVAGLRLDPWLTHRLLRGVPLALLLFGAAGLAVAAWLRRRGRLSAPSRRVLAALAVAAFLLRALAVSHPDFYYPDQRTHARLVEKVQEEGLGFFANPSRAIWEHGVWRTEAHGKTYAFPYSPAFHLPFTLLPLGYDARLVAMKLWAAGVSVAPLFLTWALARWLGLSVLGAALMALVPTYTSRLSFAFMPALFGHVFDLALIGWLALHLDAVRAPRTWLAGAAWVAAAQLAYVSGVMNTAALVVCLALLLAVLLRRPADAAAVLGLGLLGAAVSVALYYRDFLGMAADVAARAGLGAEGAPSRYPVRPVLAVAWQRTRDFFDGVYPLLAAGGLALAWREREPRAGPTPAVSLPARRALLGAWLGAYLLLLAGRARVPDVFLHGHETLLVTPVVCLLAGVTLHRLAQSSPAGRAAAVLAGIFLAVQGLHGQWAALAAQLGNAR